MDVGKIIKEKRTQKNMTQEDLAKEFFVTRQLISKWENGKSYPDLEQLLKLSDFFEMSLDELMKGDKKMTKKLTFDTKQKKLLTILMVILVGLIVNGILSKIEFRASSNDLSFKDVELYETYSNKVFDPTKDYNVVFLAKVKSNNIFMQANSDSLLVSSKDNPDELKASMTWSFNLFNVFNIGKYSLVNQTTRIDTKKDSFKLRFENSKKTVPVKLYK